MIYRVVFFHHTHSVTIPLPYHSGLMNALRAYFYPFQFKSELANMLS